MPAGQLGVSGVINANGTINWSTENFTCEKTATGTYKITYTGAFSNMAAPQASPIGTGVTISLSECTKSGCVVKSALLLTLVGVDSAFSFSATE